MSPHYTLKHIMATLFAITSRLLLLAEQTYSHSMQNFNNDARLPSFSDCFGKQKLNNQPEIRDLAPKYRKCCPEGQSYTTKNICKPQTEDVPPDLAFIEFYDGDCIKHVKNRHVNMNFQVGNPCNEYDEFSHSLGDLLLVIQNGDLLLLNPKNYSERSITSDYCLDTRLLPGSDKLEVYAMVCVRLDQDVKFTTLQSIINASFILISIPSLCAVSFLYFTIKELRSVHGVSLGLMCVCLALGFTFHAIGQVFKTEIAIIEQAKSYFILSYFCWLFCLCCNLALQVLYYLPANIGQKRCSEFCHLVCFGLFSFLIPLVLVISSQNKMPFLMEMTFNDFTWIPGSQRNFVPPIAMLLLASLSLLVAIYYKLNKLENILRQYVDYQFTKAAKQGSVPDDILNPLSLKELKEDAKSVSYLFLIKIVTWLLEILDYYFSLSIGNPCFKPMINALHGVLILLIFIYSRHGSKRLFSRWQLGHISNLEEAKTNQLSDFEEILEITN